MCRHMYNIIQMNIPFPLFIIFTPKENEKPWLVKNFPRKTSFTASQTLQIFVIVKFGIEYGINKYKLFDIKTYMGYTYI